MEISYYDSDDDSGVEISSDDYDFEGLEDDSEDSDGSYYSIIVCYCRLL